MDLSYVCVKDVQRFLELELHAGSGGLDRKICVYRLPENDWSLRTTLIHTVAFSGNADLPVYVRVTQADGNQAWSSPIYLIPG